MTINNILVTDIHGQSIDEYLSKKQNKTYARQKYGSASTRDQVVGEIAEKNYEQEELVIYISNNDFVTQTIFMKNNKIHRTDGPAFIVWGRPMIPLDTEWYYNGKKVPWKANISFRRYGIMTDIYRVNNFDITNMVKEYQEKYGDFDEDNFFHLMMMTSNFKDFEIDI